MRPLDHYWPPFLQEIKEFQEIAKAATPEIEAIWKAIEALVSDQFIGIATERGIRRREKLLGITPAKGDDLEYRRYRVLARWNDRLPYTYRVLKSRLDQLFPNSYKLDVRHDEYLLQIEINTFNWQAYDDFVNDIRHMVPANMGIQSSLVQKTAGAFYCRSAMVCGEEITVYPWSPKEISSKGTVHVALGHNTGIDITIIYPRGSD